MVTVKNVTFSAKTQLWCVVVVIILATVVDVAALNGPNVCMVKQKYNITKRVKYRAPMSVRTYEWCLSIPPRCSKWNTEMRDLTRLETEERTAEVAVCCPGFKMNDVSCVPICPNGKTGHGCSEDCPESKWGPNCVNICQPCSDHGSCSPITGECFCQDGWQGESCESRMSSTTSTTTTTTTRVEELLTKIVATKPIPPITSTVLSTTRALVENTSTPAFKTTLLQSTSTSKGTSLDAFSSFSSPTTITTKKASSKNDTIFEETTLNPGPKNSNEISPKTILKTSLEIIPNSNESTTLGSGSTKTETLPTTASPLTTSATTLISLEVTKAKMPVMATSLTTNTSTQTSTSTTIFTTKPTTSVSAKTTSVTEIVTENVDKVKTLDKTTTTTSTESNKLPVALNNMTLPMSATIETFKPRQTTVRLISNSIHNRTEPPRDTRKYVKEIHVEIKTTPIKIIKSSEMTSTAIQQKTTTTFSETPTSSHASVETTRRPDATIRYFPTTVKFKPKEIWIRPAQKGESFVDGKKINHDMQLKYRATNKEPIPTTPKTIIVSIIPTSVSYATYKKIALTTSSLLSQATNKTLKSYNRSMEQGYTKPMSVLTTTPSPLISRLSTTKNLAENTKINNTNIIANTSKSNTHIYRATKTLSTLSNTRTIWKNKTVSLNGTNSMRTVIQNLNSSNSVTPTVPSNSMIHAPNATGKIIKDVTKYLEKVTKHTFINHPVKHQNVTKITLNGKDKAIKMKTVVKDLEKTNATKPMDIANAKTNKITTQSPDDEETFHILTEPEHITAVMEGNGKESTSVDLISVVSIAGGIMMAMITVAVIIVMIERCRRPRYEDVRKMNDIHMQVMIDNSDVPPPYVRSIFHTPLPDPPTSEKCHYQPISTLDRNLKQFMRPVVVQTISPIMLENFRGILECHYDHLPRRSHDFEASQKHCSIAPSVDDVNEFSHLRPCSIAESTIEALKCEAKLDVLDSTTSEPLYAEIPCWRPPSEHAIEIMNLNGEAVTEL